MMTRHLLIPDFSGRDADPRSGATAELCSFGRKASLGMRISAPLVAGEADNPGSQKPSEQNQTSTLDGKTAPEAIISLT